MPVVSVVILYYLIVAVPRIPLLVNPKVKTTYSETILDKITYGFNVIAPLHIWEIYYDFIVIAHLGLLPLCKL